MNENELDELRLKVAEARGLRAVNHPVDDDPSWIIEDANGNQLSGWWTKEYGAWADFFENHDYSRDIAAAWELAEDAEKVGVGFDLTNVRYEESKLIRYEATFYDPWGGPKSLEYKFEAATAPIAIARAFLAWKEGQP
jgi:hypothetical protein